MNRITNNILLHNAPTEINTYTDLQINPITHPIVGVRTLVSRGVFSNLSSRSHLAPSQIGGSSLYQTKPNNITGTASNVLLH